MLKYARKMYALAGQKVHSRFAPIWFVVIFVLEIFLFIPLDAVLMLFCLEKRSYSFLYAALAACGSTLSGILGFCIGYFFWDFVGRYAVDHFVMQAFLQQWIDRYHQHQHLILGIGALLPLPFKVVALSAGFCNLPLHLFIMCVAAARLIRFSCVALCMYLWGAQVKEFIDRYFHRILIVVGMKVILTIGFFWILTQYGK